MSYAHASINDMSAAVAAGDLTHAGMVKILRERAKRENSRGAVRAQAWLAANAKPARATKTTPAPVKTARVVDPHTELRKLAWADRVAAQARGEKLTYAQACEARGTFPARKAA